MTAFVVVAVLMVAITLAWVLVPLLRARAPGMVARDASNVAILRDQLAELDADLANGTLSQAQHAKARRELERRVLEESVAAPAAAAAQAPPRAARRTAFALAAILPVAALVLYAAWGNRDAFGPLARLDPDDVTPAKVNELVGRLEARLQKEPKNVDGWVILARSYGMLNRYADSVRAYERAVALVPEDADLLADYADALGAARGTLEGKPMQVVERALAIDPKHWKALALAGTAAFDRQDYRGAVDYWENVKRAVPANSPMGSSIDASIAEARRLAGMPAAGKGAAGAQASARPGPPFANAAPVAAGAAGPKLEGRVVLSAALASKAAPDDTVFIYARAAQGPKMPLAILRRQVKDLPVSFALDDAMAMSPTMTLSRAGDVVVVARVSRSGTATPQSGDLEGMSPTVRTGARGVDIVIDKALP